MKLIALLVLIILQNLLCYSQLKNEKKIFTLNQCIEIGLKNNPDVKLWESRLSPASAEVTSAFGSFLPSVSYSAGYRRLLSGNTLNIEGQKLPFELNPNSYDMSLNASILLFNGFSRESNYNKAQESLKGLIHQNSYIKKQLRNTIIKQYFEVYRNKQVVNIRIKNFELGNKDLERIKALYEAGSVPITSVYAQEAELGARELEIVKAENDLKIAITSLLTTMGLEPTEESDFSDESILNEISKDEIKKFRENIGTQDDIIKDALENRMDYKSAQSNIDAALSAITSTESGYYPTLSAYGGWSWNNSELSKFSELGKSYIGLNLQLPIFENFKTNYNIELSKLDLKVKETELFQLKQKISTEVKTALLNLESSEKQLEITDRSLKSSEKNYEATKEKYELGSLSISDYMLANNLRVTAEINKITSVYNYLVAQKELLFVSGRE